MIGSIICFIVSVIFAILCGYSIKDLRDKNKKAMETGKPSEGNFLGMWLWLMGITIAFFGCMYDCDTLGKNYIDRYKNDEIVEQTTYHYETLQSGEKVCTDSTTMYIRSKRK